MWQWPMTMLRGFSGECVCVCVCARVVQLRQQLSKTELMRLHWSPPESPFFPFRLRFQRTWTRRQRRLSLSLSFSLFLSISQYSFNNIQFHCICNGCAAVLLISTDDLLGSLQFNAIDQFNSMTIFEPKVKQPIPLPTSTQFSLINITIIADTPYHFN